MSPDADGAAARTADLSNYEGLADNLKVLGNPKRLRLLHFLTHPHYLEEIASELKMARQTAQEHVEQLVEIGVLERVRGRTERGPVTNYVVVPQRLFAIYEEVGKLGVLQPELDGASPLRALTTPLQTGAAQPRIQDVPRLSIVHGMRIGQTTGLTGNGPWLLGREAHAAVCLDYDPFVSMRHAEVRRVPGGFELADLYSSNGSFVEWARVPRGGAQKLDNGSVMRLGRTLLVFRRPTLTD